MDIDLGEGWEKKALIVVAVVVFILVAYAYNTFQPKPNITSANESYKPPSPARVNPPSIDSNESNNSAETSQNNTFLISSDKAKQIALAEYSGYSASEPMHGTIVLNQTTVVVWIVPLTKSSQPSKTVYVDVNTGKIVKLT